MADLARLFIDMRDNKANYLGGTDTGKQFEKRIANGLDNARFNPILKRDIEKSVLTQLQQDTNDHFHPAKIKNPLTKYRRHYLAQPSGSQKYPDFLIFLNDRVICIEAKFSTKKQVKPVWNGGLPRQHGIYIFAARGRGDLTFFIGRDVISEDSAREMHKFFDDYLRTKQRQFNVAQPKQEYGFGVYARKAFDQTQRENDKAVINYFTNKSRAKLEQSVIDFASRG